MTEKENQLQELVEQLKTMKILFDFKDQEYKDKFEEALKNVDKVVNDCKSMTNEYENITYLVYDKIVTIPYSDKQNADLRDKQMDEYFQFLNNQNIETYVNYGAWLPSSYQC